MLDIKFIRENPDLVKDSLKNRNLKLELDNLIALDDSRRKTLAELEELRSQRNKANDEMSVLLKEKKGTLQKIDSMKAISVKIDELELRLKEFDNELNKLLLTIPNVPDCALPLS